MNTTTLRLVPFLTPDSAHLFVDVEQVEPWIDPDVGYATSALKFGVKFDMLGAATTEEMYESGVADTTDSIDLHINLDKIFYRTPNGKVHALDVSQRKGAKFEPSATGVGRLTTETKFQLDPLGIPTTIIEKVVYWWRNHFGHRQMVPAKVSGIIETEVGSVLVHASAKEGSGIEVVGYTLNCQRVNYSRRPTHAQAEFLT